MKIALDIGNTSVTVGLFNKDKLLNKKYFNSTSDLIDFLDNIQISNIEISIISSVVPQLTDEYINIFTNEYNIPSIVIDHKMSGLDLCVPNPETIGSDRLCNIYALKKEYTSPSIIIDFGTATTYDVINEHQQFIGGAIAPGIETSAKYLIKKAALLSKTDLLFPNKVIGKNTKTNIQSGIMFGAVDQVEGMIKRINIESPADYFIILTGGFANLISEKLSFKHTLDQNLTLKGIKYIYEYNI
tara:strand:+ start:157 stop:885 length:729 start_codon:yes stop_codon:yes gene_type:complete